MPTWYRERLAEHMSAVTVCQSPLRVTLRPQALAIDPTDGVGLEFENWRFNLRPSNTEPLIRFNMETMGDRSLLEEKKDEIMKLVEESNR